MAAQTASAMQAWRQQLLTGPGLEMEGLRAAGINPMLRYGSGGSATPMSMVMPSATAPTNRLEGLAAGIGQIGSSALSAANTVQSMDESRQRVTNMTSDLIRNAVETTRVIADTRLTNQQRENAVAENARIFQQTALGIADEYLRYAQANLSRAQAGEVAAMVDLIHQQLETENERTRQMHYQAFLTGAQAEAARAGTTLAHLDSAIWGSAMGRWLRETILMRDATGASGVLGVGQAALTRFLSGIEDMFE